jgi:hypothetical protein
VDPLSSTRTDLSVRDCERNRIMIVLTSIFSKSGRVCMGLRCAAVVFMLTTLGTSLCNGGDSVLLPSPSGGGACETKLIECPSWGCQTYNLSAEYCTTCSSAFPGVTGFLAGQVPDSNYFRSPITGRTPCSMATLYKKSFGQCQCGLADLYSSWGECSPIWAGVNCP